jgi:hypothetical protein
MPKPMIIATYRGRGSSGRISHGVDAESLQAIGLVSVHWGGLEVLVDAVITQLLKVSPDQSHAILTGLSFHVRLGMLATLAAQIKQTRRRTALEKIAEGIRAAQSDRNFIIHAMWIGGGKDNQGQVLRRNEKKVRLERWTATKISETADRIAAAQLDLIGWMGGGPRSRQRSARYGASVMLAAGRTKGTPA